jgi:MraZ protein
MRAGGRAAPPARDKGDGGLQGIAMALFIDTFVNKIDRKGRVSVPAPYRTSLAAEGFAGLVAFPSYKRTAVHCASLAWMEAQVANLQKEDLFSEVEDDLSSTLFSDAKQLPFDGEGRIVLPPALAAHAGIGENAAFVGRGPYFEIWEPAALEQYKRAARQRALEKGRTVPQRPEGGA